MKKNEIEFKSGIRPLIAGVVSALSLIGTAQAASKFADVPIYLQVDKNINSGVNVPPNVMLLIDDSGSMNSKIGSKTRLDITKEAIGGVLQTYGDKVNWGLQTLNNTANLDGYTTDWQLVRDKINSIAVTPSMLTPTTRRYYETAQKVMANMDNQHYRCETNYIVLMSDGDANMSCTGSRYYINRNTNQIGGRVEGLAFAYSDDGYFGNADAYFGTSDIQTNLNYCSYNGSNFDHNYWDKKDGLRFFSNKLKTTDFKTSGTDKAGKSWNGHPDDPKDEVTGLSKYKDQTVETLTIGFGSSISQDGKTYLQRGAASSIGNGGYYTATDASELIAAFNEIFWGIDSQNQDIRGDASTKGSIAPAPTSTGLADLAAFVRLDPASWSSQLHFYQINANGSVNTTAATSQPSFNNRKTLISTGSAVYWMDSVKDNEMRNADFGIAGGNPVDALEWKRVLLPWTARSTADATLKTLAENNRYSQAYRTRAAGTRDLGDILNSTVAAVGGNTVQNKAEFLVTAANDGMVHLFQSTSGNNPYDLKLSYIPAGMEREDDNGIATTMGRYLKDVAHENYGTNPQHRYMVNGGFVVRQTAAPNGTAAGEPKGQQVFMFGAMGQGGRGAYALNIGGKNRATGQAIGLNNTNSSQWITEVPLFETPKGAANTLGYTIGEPQIGRVSLDRAGSKPKSLTANVRYAGFLASGYRSKDLTDADGNNINETALYIYDMLGQEAYSGAAATGAKAGNLIRKITVSDGVGGLSAPTLVDVDFDGTVDIAYAGDYGGHMYRFDLRGDKPENWSVNRIFAGNGSRPITAAPAISRRSNGKYVVLFGTGSDIYQDDAQKQNSRQQALYGIYDDVAAAATAAADTDLQEQTISKETRDGREYIFLSNEKVGTGKKGWMALLSLEDGERVVAKPMMILNTAVFNIRSYQQESKKIERGTDICIPEVEEVRTASSTSLVGVNAENGGGLNQRNARFTPDIVIKRDADSGVNYYANGFKMEGLVSFTMMDASRIGDSPVTADGDSGGSGTDQALGQLDRTPNNCFRAGAVRNLLGNDLSNHSVTGRICGVNRISWRELF